MIIEQVLVELDQLKELTNDAGKAMIESLKTKISAFLVDMVVVDVPVITPEIPPLVHRVVVDVTSGTEGSWRVKVRGAHRAAGVFEDKPDAVKKAKEIAKISGLGQIVVHGRDGQIQYENTYGEDPVESVG